MKGQNCQLRRFMTCLSFWHSSNNFENKYFNHRLIIAVLTSFPKCRDDVFYYFYTKVINDRRPRHP
ncbi:Uncharacterized protein BN963_SGAL_01850 [Streptococcus gallolyticus]|uniref:Uncharacterized protein n=1 Tax=Streptococcus gallolyticus TaxID=315405 RepID=A0A060RL42_9STRE|nr:hypothetical protein SGGBAA2069_c19660 [Streptococcus gallolyticus subsp. gallolyticus ATCC BAA-2069]CDO18647.1 Uncharacterized protein BN963_SGAL_01850 [Streptococcus gallolyticus]